MYTFNFFDGKFAVNNDFIFMAILASTLSLCAISQKTRTIQERIYGENFSNTGKWLALLGGVLLFYTSLSYISALDFNPFIYFRF
jgi:drug/metabolite transporter (DMT)-like permease